MPSNSAGSPPERLSRRTVTTVTAIAVALPSAYAFHGEFPGDESAVLLLIAVAVGVPRAFDYGPEFERYRDCVFATLWTCSAVVVAYVACFVAGVDLLSVSPLLAGGLAFLAGVVGSVGILAALC
jgi:hypothetical protein